MERRPGLATPGYIPDDPPDLFSGIRCTQQSDGRWVFESHVRQCSSTSTRDHGLYEQRIFIYLGFTYHAQDHRGLIGVDQTLGQSGFRLSKVVKEVEDHVPDVTEGIVNQAFSDSILCRTDQTVVHVVPLGLISK